MKRFSRNTDAKRNSGDASRSLLKSLVTRLKKSRNSDLDDFMVIGIDFGTTYSGAAWATVADFENDQINLIQSWPGTGREEGKAPTELFYEHGEVMWGYGVPSEADPVSWFKLLLLKDEDLNSAVRDYEFVMRARKMMRESEKTAVDLIADYLRELWKHILATIAKARGQSVLDALSFHVVITVPAIWKNYARDGMQEAARKAGIFGNRRAGPTTLSFAPEPEAAALSSLCEPGRTVNAKDVFVICDAGGGTVDLISYEVADTDPITLREAVVGTGGLCGGIFVDQAFESMCKARLGRNWSRLSQTGIKSIMKREWEDAIKPQFNNLNEYIVGIPAEAFKGAKVASMDDTSRKPVIRDGRIHFASSDIEKTFAKPVSEIASLIDDQINLAEAKGAKVSGVILVGGFGSSPYLHQYLQDKYSRKSIDILQSTGTKPRTAICRGAIYKGFIDAPAAGAQMRPGRVYVPVEAPISIVSTIARQSLGVDYYRVWDSDIDDEEERSWSSTEEGWIVDHLMEWYLRKGDDVKRQDPVRHAFYGLYKSKEDYDEDHSLNILQCFAETPPGKLKPGVDRLCSINYKFPTPYQLLPDYTTMGGKVVKKASYEIEMVPSGASIEFSLYYDGKKLGSEVTTVEDK